MAQPLTLAGPNILFYLNNIVYKVTQSVTLSVDYSEEPVYGIDSPWPQEIFGNRVTIKGSVRGLRLKYSGGLQAVNARPLFQDLAASPYINLRIVDRTTGENIAFIPQAKVSNETHVIETKTTYKLNFDFQGQMILWALDRS